MGINILPFQFESEEGTRVEWLVLCVNLTQAGALREEGASVEEDAL